MRRTETTAQIIMCLTSLALMQWHSIEYWLNKTGPIGIGWSLGIECAAIYFWLYRKTFAAVIASGLLISGPLLAMAQPTMDEIQKQTNIAAERELLTQSLELRTGSLKDWRANSIERTGWGGRIDRTQAKIDATENQLIDAIRQQENTYALLTTPLIQAAALLLILFAQITALRKLSTMLCEKNTNTHGKTKTEKKTAEKKPRPQPAGARKKQSGAIPAGEIQRALKAAIEAEGTTASRWATDRGLTPKKASQIINHQDLKKKGGDTASRNTWLEFAKLLNIEINSENDKQKTGE
jgi:hypothetical protein